jgi:argininosuccinate synthase
MLGIDPSNIYIEDVREEFVRDFVFPMFRANALYEGLYLLGTSIARPLISKRLVEIAAETGADAVAHGATGKGNDQVRFELAAYALNPDIKVIAPWREWDLTSRTKLLDFAEKNQIPIAKDKRGEAPFSVDANLLHTSSEGKVLEDPARQRPITSTSGPCTPRMRPIRPKWSRSPLKRAMPWPSTARRCRPPRFLTKLNELGGKHGVGRLDLVENRFVGMKSRGIYETPGGTILLEAHRGIEQITLDSGAGHLKDSIMPRYAELIYNGFWFSPRTRNASGPDRQEPRTRHRHCARETLQRLLQHRCPLVGSFALFRSARDLRRRRRVPTTRKTRKASSSSTHSV